MSVHAERFFTYVGTYTGGESQGIYRAIFDSETGTFADLELAAEVENPSFLAVHPNGKYLYAVGEVSEFEDQQTGFVAAYRLDPKSGELTLLNRVASSGTAPCHLNVDQTGRFVLVANYGSGTASVIRIEEDGSLGDRTAFQQHEGSSVNAQRQEGPHAHSINLDAQNRFAFVADLGLDKVMIYRFDSEKGSLQPNDPAFVQIKAGAGPRHFSFHPSQKFAYVINELDSTITALKYDADKGSLEPIQSVSTLPSDHTDASYTAEVVVHPSGKFVYGSNRGHDSIACFQVDAETGEISITAIESTRGQTPRNFVIDPTGKYLLAENQGTDMVTIFEIDATKGTLQGSNETLDVPSPVCIRFAKIQSE
ncbi:MAG: lactonase family protein [Pirellulaceae bacterium]